MTIFDERTAMVAIPLLHKRVQLSRYSGVNASRLLLYDGQGARRVIMDVKHYGDVAEHDAHQMLTALATAALTTLPRPGRELHLVWGTVGSLPFMSKEHQGSASQVGNAPKHG